MCHSMSLSGRFIFYEPPPLATNSNEVVPSPLTDNLSIGSMGRLYRHLHE